MQLRADNGNSRAFIVCEEPQMQQQMGRVSVPIAHLQQWQCSAALIAKCLQGLLGLSKALPANAGLKAIQLGMLHNKQGRRWVSLQQQPLGIEINGMVAPLEEVLYFEAEQLLIDQQCIDRMLSTKRHAGDEGNTAYQPSTQKQLNRKLKTQAMYQDWKDAYRRLKKQHPQQSDTWVSKQIAKLDIGQEKSELTIYKNMK